MNKPRFLRKKFIVEPVYQYTLIAVMVVVALVNILTFVLASNYFFDQFIGFSDMMGFPATHPFRNLILGQRDVLSTFFVYASVINVVLIFVLGLFLSNRTAGPIYRIIKSLEKMSETGEIEDITIRKNDSFQKLPQAINNVLQKFKK